ncbi:MAG: tetratricopeptide repeat protein [Spartobacteria bacterium]|nr:tetratricopeptide repeat protein [Spartobacteria bacterium]
MSTKKNLVWLALGFLAFMSVFGEQWRNPFEPVVTRRESEQLNAAMDMAATNPVEAIAMLRAENGPEASAALDFAIGNLAFQANDLEPAAQAYQAALDKLPKFRSALLNFGRVRLVQGQTDKAIGLYRTLVADGQADADTLQLLGHALLMEDDPVSAETAYRQSLLLGPEEADTRQGLAKALMRQERYTESALLLGPLLKQDPFNAELWSLRANASIAEGNYADAAQAIETARRLDCANSEMLATLGDIYINREQPVEAITAYEDAFAGTQPSSARLLRAAEGLLLTGDTAGAENMLARAESGLSEAPRPDPDSARSLLRLKGALARQIGDTAGAEAACESLLRRDPLDGETMLLLAEIQDSQGRLEEAVMTLERAARVRGFEADALARQAQIEVARGRYNRAVELLEAAQAFEDRPHVARYLEQVRRLR